MLGGEIGKITFGRIKYKFRTSSNKNSSLCTIYWYTAKVRTARLLLLLLKLLLLLGLRSVCHAEGFVLLLAKGSDRIAALNPCKQKHPLKLSAYINRTVVMLDQGCGREASPSWDWRQFSADTRASKLKGKPATKIKIRGLEF